MDQGPGELLVFPSEKEIHKIRFHKVDLQKKVVLLEIVQKHQLQQRIIKNFV